MKLTHRQLAEVIHAEHHPGTFVPDLDSCPEHTRAEYERLARKLSGDPDRDGDEAPA